MSTKEWPVSITATDVSRDLIMNGNAIVPIGKSPDEMYRPLKMDTGGRVLAALDDATLDRIAERVADLLDQRKRSGER